MLNSIISFVLGSSTSPLFCTLACKIPAAIRRCLPLHSVFSAKLFSSAPSIPYTKAAIMMAGAVHGWPILLRLLMYLLQNLDGWRNRSPGQYIERQEIPEQQDAESSETEDRFLGTCILAAFCHQIRKETEYDAEHDWPGSPFQSHTDRCRRWYHDGDHAEFLDLSETASWEH